MIDRDRKSNFVTLRTVPVILKNGNRTINVNALLDDASTKTYINADVAVELGLQGQVQKVTVNVLNDNVEIFETMPVEVRLQSHNGQTDANIVASTTNRVTGNNIVRKFWEIENVKTPSENVFLNSDEQKALSKVEQSLELKDVHYEVKVSWKDDTPLLPNNYNMALHRLENTEKRLKKDPSIAKDYTQTIGRKTVFAAFSGD
ncbi:unnamed protein product [Mytilus coruscus]|uniref:Peptidase aspartic putative domain-containing protein n=1 Tax=Mytilus coruscus TaxID=42192 RepID=A0A6J8EW87_MYTCO|nr:unnamed protein product [Mytilus coruscus]